MKVQSIMSKDVFSVVTNQTLNEAAKVMWEHNCGCVPVVNEQNEAVGMLTDRDIAMASYINGKGLSDIPVTDVLSRDLISASPQDDISEVELKMQTHQVRRIPILGKNAELVGILSMNDIALACQDRGSSIKPKEVSDTLAAICRPHFLLDTKMSVA
jgi:CBS domain-containing protein